MLISTSHYGNNAPRSLKDLSNMPTLFNIPSARTKSQLYNCQLVRTITAMFLRRSLKTYLTCQSCLNTVGMLDKFLRERGKHIISVMVRTNSQLYNRDLVRAEGY